MRNRLMTLLLPLFAACSIESGSTGSAEGDRGGLGKADVVGSCMGKHDDRCGSHGTGNCWCDEACVDFGDCCSDAEAVCGIEQPEPEGVICGGFLGQACSDDEYCAFEIGAICGWADATGVCTDRPDACIALYDPVCGCDGNTYGNSCSAASAGTSVQHEGECEEAPAQFCGGFAGIACEGGLECVDDPSDDCDPANGGADCGGICVPVSEQSCETLEADFAAEVGAVRACESDDECGQVMAGTSCGCTRNWVARTDADLAGFEALRGELESNGCELPGGISTCDCPAADGFACEAGVCSWNYL